MAKCYIKVIAIFLLVLSCRAVAANNHIVETAYFEDVTNALSINKIQNASFTSYQGVLNKGFSSSAYWIRLKVAASSTDKPLVLRILPTYLDHIEVYQKVDSQWLKKEVGDKHAFEQRELPTTSFGVLIMPRPTEHYIYARLKTNSTNLINFELLEMPEFMKFEGLRDLMLGVLFGINLMLLLWTLFYKNLKNDGLLILMCVFLFIELIFIASMLGFVSRFILPTKPLAADYLTSLVVIVISLLGISYHRTFISHEIPIKGLRFAFNFIAALYVIPAALFISGYFSKALEINGFLLFLNTFILFAVPIVFLIKRSFNYFFAWAYFFLSVVLMIGIAPNLGLIKASTFNLYGNIFNGLLSSLILIFLLRVRQQQKDKLASAAIESAQIAHLELEFEKTQRQRQSQFMAMLAHEFRTPLYLLRLIIDSAVSTHKFGSHADQAVSDMHAILERCEQVARYEGVSKENLQRSEFNPLVIVDNLIAANKASDMFMLEVLDRRKLNTDEVLFKIIISNLIENAVKYSAPKSRISICISTHMVENQSYWNFKIMNQTGKSGAPDPLTLFDKYYRSEKARNISGSGLGLYLVKSLTELLDGFVEYESIGKQVQFDVCFPN